MTGLEAQPHRPADHETQFSEYMEDFGSGYYFFSFSVVSACKVGVVYTVNMFDSDSSDG